MVGDKVKSLIDWKSHLRAGEQGTVKGPADNGDNSRLLVEFAGGPYNLLPTQITQVAPCHMCRDSEISDTSVQIYSEQHRLNLKKGINSDTYAGTLPGGFKRDRQTCCLVST